MPDYVPALKGKMGDWTYYVTVMKLGKVARECRIAEDIRANPELENLIQRALQDRVQKEMVPYLLNEPQRFYGALVVAVYGGEPEFSPVRVAEHELIDDSSERDSYGFGLLRFDGSQVYYALDGQHRLKSIQEAIRLEPDLSKDEISVIILKHEETKDGLERTRRLFSTLNRRAKPTKTGLNIAIDEDDSVAIVTRRLVKENDNLKNLVLSGVDSINAKQLSRSKKNDPYITTLAAFYEANEILLSCFNDGMEIDSSFKQFRKSFEELDDYYKFLEDLWERMLAKCPDFYAVLRGSKTPGDIRKRVDDAGAPVFDEKGNPVPGGNVFARPIGQYTIADTLKLVSLHQKSLEDAIDTIMANVSMNIDDAPWVNVIWNPNDQTIKGGKKERALISNLIAHALGLKTKMGVRDLKQKYREISGMKKVTLPPQVQWSGNTEFTSPEEDLDGEESGEEANSSENATTDSVNPASQ